MAVRDIGELRTFGGELLGELQVRTGAGAAVIALHGDLGAGKTTFVQQLAAALGVEDTITSPTFVIMKQYETVDDHFSKLVHIDAYRIEEIDEMRVLRFGELAREKGTIMCIEWAERIAELLPEDTTHLTFTINADETRTVTIHGHPKTSS